jgi:uncharacterized membrane protein YkoI
MARTQLLAVLLFLGLWTSGVLAQGNSGGNANSNASSSSAGSDNNSHDTGNSQSSNNNGNSAQPDNRPNPQANAYHPEEEALQAVQSGRAVPLSRIVGVLERTNGGEVLDAKLVRAGSVLLYRLKLLLPDGSVTTEFYHAPTGQPVDR